MLIAHVSAECKRGSIPTLFCALHRLVVEEPSKDFGREDRYNLLMLNDLRKVRSSAVESGSRDCENVFPLPAVVRPLDARGPPEGFPRARLWFPRLLRAPEWLESSGSKLALQR